MHIISSEKESELTLFVGALAGLVSGLPVGDWVGFAVGAAVVPPSRQSPPWQMPNGTELQGLIQ